MDDDLAKSLDKLNYTLQRIMPGRCSECWHYTEWGWCMRPDGDGDYIRMEMNPDDYCSKFYHPEWYLTDDKGGV